MDWLIDLARDGTAAGSVITLGAVIALGLALGGVRVRGIGLGVAGVLFAGLLFGHFGMKLDRVVLDFARELGLILFVFAIGLQVGPGFSAALRREGLALNALAAGVVVMGAIIAVGGAWLAGLEIPAAVGTLAGATTNTPSLAAAQSALADMGATPDAAALPGVAYAVAYPFGVIGIILAMLLLRSLFRVDVAAEKADLERRNAEHTEVLERVNLCVANAALEGRALGEISLFEESGVIISRVQHNGEQHVATPETVLHAGDIVLAVGPRPKLHALRLLVGPKADIDLRDAPSAIESRRLIVTKKSVLGKTVMELGLRARYGVQITRVSRAGVELPVSAALRLQYGDRAIAVGEAAGLDNAAQILGNSARALSHPDLIPLFLGIVIGVAVGSIPIDVPGVPAPVKLGLAGGPLITAILLSQVQRVGPLVWYLPESASFVLRELGIVIFLACVGLKSGEHFVATLFSTEGAVCVALGACVTFVPIIVAGAIARRVMKLNYLSVCGLLAGSMTDPPALAFATNVTASDAPTVSYAAVYPLTMVARIVTAQIIVLVAAG
ncbi:MAG: putative transporter [Candidatus Hydrogenedentes bacterium]|nr:putative transporter [Candidatus Hydrogenedentota bacterium]